MTAAAYGRFYAGTYRPLVSAYHGRLIDARTIQAGAARVRRSSAATCSRRIVRRAAATDRCSTSAAPPAWSRSILAERFGLRATVIDPAPLETAEAQALGIETIDGLVESVDLGDRRFDLVVLCQTVDHLLDVAGTLRRVRELLTAGGLLFVDIVDFRAAYLRNWSVEEAVKIDHPYYLTEPTMTAYLRRAGFDVLRTDYAADHLHVSYVARPVARRCRTRCRPEHDVRELCREVRFVQNAPRP